MPILSIIAKFSPSLAAAQIEYIKKPYNTSNGSGKFKPKFLIVQLSNRIQQQRKLFQFMLRISEGNLHYFESIKQEVLIKA